MILKLKNEDINRGCLILVNERYALACEEHELMRFERAGVSAEVENKAALMLGKIFERIQCGDRIVPVSGYRPFKEQKDIFETSMTENGEEYTRKFVALPGHSEHQTGLAIDLGLNEGEIDFICPEFPYKGICQFFRETAPEYGFIERYTKNGSDKTGIAHEPWHFRYVGEPHAEFITIRNMVLEEYIEFLRSFTAERPLELSSCKNSWSVYYVAASPEGETEITLPDNCEYEISGNNVDGFIITIKH